MLIILFLFVPILIQIFKNDVNQKRIGYYALLIIAVYLFWYIVLYWELSYISEDGTYGSDASYYWLVINNISKGLDSYRGLSAPLFVLWGSLLLKSSIINSFSIIVIANILLMSNAYILQAKSLLSRVDSRKSKSLLTLLFLLWTNGIVIWMTIRGLKEPLFIILLFVWIFYWENIVKYQQVRGSIPEVNRKARTDKLSRGVLFIISTMFLSVLLNNIRTGSYLLIFPYMLTFIINKTQRRRLFVIVNAGIIFIFAILFLNVGGRVDYYNIFKKEYGEVAFDTSPKIIRETKNAPASELLAIGRFISGPGPIRSFRQLVTGDVFVISTRVGDVLIFLGSCVWWLCLVVMLLKIIRNKKIISVYKTYMGWIFLSLAFILIYSNLYYGTGDTRHRAVMYLLASPILAISLLEAKSKYVVKRRIESI